MWDFYEWRVAKRTCDLRRDTTLSYRPQISWLVTKHLHQHLFLFFQSSKFPLFSTIYEAERNVVVKGFYIISPPHIKLVTFCNTDEEHPRQPVEAGWGDGVSRIVVILSLRLFYCFFEFGFICFRLNLLWGSFASNRSKWTFHPLNLGPCR